MKVDAKTRKDLLKYIIMKKKGPAANMEEVSPDSTRGSQTYLLEFMLLVYVGRGGGQ